MTMTAKGREHCKRFRTGETDARDIQDRKDGQFLSWRAREYFSLSRAGDAEETWACTFKC